MCIIWKGQEPHHSRPRMSEKAVMNTALLLSLMDCRDKLALTAAWLVIAAMVCGAFALNGPMHLTATAVLALALLLAFSLSLLQMILNADGPKRMLFLLFAGGWVMTAWLLGAEWLHLDVRQMRGWLIANMLLVGACVWATWWEEMRWRRAAALLGATVGLWILCGPADVVNRMLDGGETWDVSPVAFRDPFFLGNGDDERLIASNMAWRRMPGRQNTLATYRDGAVVTRVTLHDDLSAIGMSLPWDGHFAILQTINTYPPTATGPMETWVDVYDATLQKISTVETPAMNHAWISPQPHFRFGSDESPWRMIPLVNAGATIPLALPGRPTLKQIMLWNQESGETRIVDDYWGGYIGGWVDEETLSHLRVESEEDDRTGRVVSSTLQVELLNIHTGEVTSWEPMTFDGSVIVRWQHRDEISLVRTRDGLILINWQDRTLRELGSSSDDKSLHVLEGDEGLRIAWATDPGSDGTQTLNVMNEDGAITTLDGLDQTVSDVWLSPDGTRVLFSQTRILQELMNGQIVLERGAVRVWDMGTGDVRTIHHRGLNDSTIFSVPPSMRMSPGCSPWSSDSRRVAIVHSRLRFIGLEMPHYVLRVVEVE